MASKEAEGERVLPGEVEAEQQQQKATFENGDNKVSIKLILVSGKTHEFNQFTPSTSAVEICQHVFENWPAG